MAAAQDIDARLATEEEHSLSAAERAFADKAMAALSEEDRATVTELDLITLVRGYQTYDPRDTETVNALKNIVEWRKTVRYHDYLRERLDRDDEFYKLWPERVHGADKYGHLTVSIPVPLINTEALMGFDQEHLLRLQGQKMTALFMHKCKHMAEKGVQRYKHTLVIDLNGMGMSLLGGKTRGFLKSLFDVGGNYFPESIWKIYVVNAPFMFRAIWAVVKPWIHPVTVAKVNILGSPKDAVKKMEEFGLPASEVPVWAGGTSEGVDVGDLLKSFVDENKDKPRVATGVEWPPLPGKPNTA